MCKKTTHAGINSENMSVIDLALFRYSSLLVYWPKLNIFKCRLEDNKVCVKIPFHSQNLCVMYTFYNGFSINSRILFIFNYFSCAKHYFLLF